jgi:hypothetical protein
MRSQVQEILTHAHRISTFACFAYSITSAGWKPSVGSDVRRQEHASWASFSCSIEGGVRGSEHTIVNSRRQ